MRRLAGLTALFVMLLAGGLMSAGGATAADNFRWLCKPGKTDSPCGTTITGMTSVDASGVETLIPPPPPVGRPAPRVDCFYVYPTVSSQPGPNADLSRDPELDSIATQQASVSDICRVFAPIYPQFTVPSILSGNISPDSIDKAYAGVKAAWNVYLKKFNRGRGVILIGHSQGTGHLGRLIEQTFDRRPNLRKRLVSAVLIGGNIYVPRGKRVGGQFQNVPACAKARQTGCAIAYSGFLSEPPVDSNFGRVTGALVTPGLDASKYEVMCVNPAKLNGAGGMLSSRYNTEPFPGIYGTLLPDLTSISTPWVRFPGMYKAACKRSGGAHWLQVDLATDAADVRPRIGEPLGRTWGTHLTEVNDAAGSISSVLKRQIASYTKKTRQASRKSQAKPK